MRNFFRDLSGDCIAALIGLASGRCLRYRTGQRPTGEAFAHITNEGMADLDTLPEVTRWYLNDWWKMCGCDKQLFMGGLAVYYVLGQAFASGLHTVEVSGDLHDAFAQMDIPIGAEHYHQPFPTVMVASKSQPRLALIMHHDRDVGILGQALVVDDGGVAQLVGKGEVTFIRGTVALWHGTLEESLTEVAVELGRPSPVVSMSTGRSADVKPLGKGNVTEEGVVEFLRVAYNAALYATHYGHLRLPDPPHKERALRRLEKARRSGDERLERLNQGEACKTPTVYHINQTVPLWRQERATAAADDAAGGSGLTMSPHWRRGHWRRQHYGKGGEQVKTIAIPAVLVNGHLFKGPLSATRTTIKG